MERFSSYEEIGKRIKMLRKQKGLNLRDLSSRVGMGFSNLARYERGEVKNLPVSTLEKIAQCLGVPATELLGISSKRTDTLIDLIDLLTDEEKTKIEEYAIFLIKNRELPQ